MFDVYRTKLYLQGDSIEA